jgi:5,10-methylenetetrahydromethanopterin reductase
VNPTAAGPRLSLNVIPECPIAEIVDLAVRAEQLGFDRCWVYDEGLVTRDVHVVMAAVAVATSRLAIGPGITNPYTRHPAQTASAIASLDELSGGRAFLGIGAGGSLTLEPIGLGRSRPLAAVRDCIEVARALFGGDAADYDGERSTLRSAAMGYGRPDIEIWLAGRGPRMLALGGELADGVMLDFIHKPSLGEYVERVRDGGPARICYSTAVVTEDDDLEFVRPHMTYRLVDAPDPVKAAIGLTPDDVGRIRAAMADGLEAAAVHVRDEWIEPFVISGNAADCADEIADLCDEHGIEEFLLPMFDMDDQHAYLERIGRALSRN